MAKLVFETDSAIELVGVLAVGLLEVGLLAVGLDVVGAAAQSGMFAMVNSVVAAAEVYDEKVASFSIKYTFQVPHVRGQ